MHNAADMPHSALADYVAAAVVVMAVAFGPVVVWLLGCEGIRSAHRARTPPRLRRCVPFSASARCRRKT